MIDSRRDGMVMHGLRTTHLVEGRWDGVVMAMAQSAARTSAHWCLSRTNGAGGMTVGPQSQHATCGVVLLARERCARTVARERRAVPYEPCRLSAPAQPE